MGGVYGRDMTSTLGEDLEYLRSIRGRFQNSKSNQQSEWACIFLFAFLVPAVFFLLCSFAGGQGHWFFAGCAVASFALGVSTWRNRGVEYEFMGDEIIEKRGGQVRNRVRIYDIVEVRVKFRPRQLIVKTNHSQMSISLVPSLNEIIRQKHTEVLAKQSESERQRYEEVKREMTSRRKWANIIGAIVSILVPVLAALMIRWFSAKH
jgi:hypothetical protein